MQKSSEANQVKRKMLFRIFDVFLLLWVLGGFIWLAVLSVERSLESTADAAQSKLHTITLVAIPWAAVIIAVGIPFTFLAFKNRYEPFWLDLFKRMVE